MISLSFVRVKDTAFPKVRKTICQIIREVYNEDDLLLGSGCLNEDEEGYFRSVSAEMEDYVAAGALRALSGYLMRYHGKKVIILLDEYDTPMRRLRRRGMGSHWRLGEARRSGYADMALRLKGREC